MEGLAPALQPVPGCSKGPSGSLFGHLVMAGTRILSWHRGHIKGFSSLAPKPKQVPPLGIDPRACPSRSVSILAFKSLVSWEEGRFGGCSPNQCPQPGFPAMYQGAYGDSGILTTHQPPWAMGWLWAVKGLLGLREGSFLSGLLKGPSLHRAWAPEAETMALHYPSACVNVASDKGSEPSLPKVPVHYRLSIPARS